jgi:hypothetical protein
MEREGERKREREYFVKDFSPNKLKDIQEFLSIFFGFIKLMSLGLFCFSV